MLNKEKTKKYGERLEKEKAEILKQIEASGKYEDFGSDIDHFDEEADEAEEFSTGESVRRELKDRLNEIDLALSRIKDGKYGICEKCGMEISEKILDIDPESRFCQHCKVKK